MAIGDLMTRDEVDLVLRQRFRDEFMKIAPHWERGETGEGDVIVNPTPLVDLSEDLVQCARAVYGTSISRQEIKVLGKLESAMLGGSIKTRTALNIIHDAIDTGKLRRGQVVFEATSGNFGIALGLLGMLGFKVVALVSRELRPGVLEELRKSGVRVVDLDVDACPAPGLLEAHGEETMNATEKDTVGATITAADAQTVESTLMSVRQQFAIAGLDPTVFDRSIKDARELLRRQDAIGLAKLLAQAYGGFCPEQYDSELNATAHEVLTGPELDQQLRDRYGSSLADFDVVCAFGTGGTSAGISRYLRNWYGKASVHIVFPLEGQDVAGIRTKGKAAGLKFYIPTDYAGQHEVDFEQAKPVLDYFAKRGYDIGESSALALLAVMQMARSKIGGRYVVILADGISKYARRESEHSSSPMAKAEVTAQEAASQSAEYSGVVWTHPVFTLSSEGARLVASSLGIEQSRVSMAETGEVERFYFGAEPLPSGFSKLVRRAVGGKLLLICTTGSTSRRIAQLLSARGIRAESLSGGIAELSRASGAKKGDMKAMSELLESPTNGQMQ